jgi:hypothetical protein
MPITLTQDTKGRYTKFAQGKNRLRILTDPLEGFQVWVDSKPVRCKAKYKTLTDAEGNVVKDKDGNPVTVMYPSEVLPTPTRPDETQKQIMVSCVWNYTTEQVEILVNDKATIITPLGTYLKDKEWGDLRNYDITINKEGEGRETKYSVIPSPKKKFDKDVKAELARMDLEKIFTGENPFVVNVKGNEESVINPDDLPF